MGYALGLIASVRKQQHDALSGRIAALTAALEGLTLTPQMADSYGLSLNKDGVRRSAFQLLSYPDIGFEQLAGIWP
ncbi:hypothetical protein M3M33_15930, partial [Loigolactobacillus coryniformis]